jgi:nicotinamidase-related amidase
LDRTRGDQPRRRRRETPGERCAREEEKADDEHAPATEDITEATAEQEKAAKGECVGAELARTFELPVVLSTINVASGQGHTLAELKAALPDTVEIDRTTMNAWEDIEFRRAIEATGRKKLIMTALWTEICLAFPTLDALRDGFEVHPVVDAVGGTSLEAHRAGLERIVQAGARPISWVGLAGELQRDWARVDTVGEIVDIVLTTRLLATA